MPDALPTETTPGLGRRAVLGGAARWPWPQRSPPARRPPPTATARHRLSAVRSVAASGARLAPDVVRLVATDAGAGPGLPGRPGRPARCRAVRQTPERVRQRHPGHRPGRADGRARASGSPWSESAPGCRSPTPWPRTTRSGSTAWPSARARFRRGSLTAPDRQHAAQRQVVATRLQPGHRRE
jgi:hypothetical protein